MNIVGHHNVIGKYIGQVAQGDDIYSVIDTGRGVVAVKGSVWQVTPEAVRRAVIDDLSEIIERYMSLGLDAKDVSDALQIAISRSYE